MCTLAKSFCNNDQKQVKKNKQVDDHSSWFGSWFQFEVSGMSCIRNGDAQLIAAFQQAYEIPQKIAK